MAWSQSFRNPSGRIFFLVGLSAGLAVTAKYSAAVILAPILAVILTQATRRWRAMALIALGCAAGVILGEPYALVRWAEWTRQIEPIIRTNLDLPAALRPSVPSLLGSQAVHSVRFLTGPGMALAEIAGLVLMLRRRIAGDLLIAAGMAGVMLSWIPLVWPMLRYDLPLLPFVAVAAAFAIARCSKSWKYALGAASVALPLLASLDQLSMMRSTHPGNQALTAILEKVPAGSVISRLTVEMPPLDRKVYPKGPNPFLEDLGRIRPEWVLTTDLPVEEYPEANRRLLAAEYEPAGEFALSRRFPWATMGEAGAPYDWKYTHPRLVLYRRRAL